MERRRTGPLIKARRARTRKPLTCGFGSPWGPAGCGSAGQPCRHCQAFTARLIEEFERDVFFGIYDREGYTPRERKWQARRAKDRAKLQAAQTQTPPVADPKRARRGK